VAIRTQTYRLDQAARRLLLLAARGAWDDAQRAKAAQLAATVVDWDAFCAVAVRSLGVCLVSRQLQTVDGVPARIVADMRAASRVLAVRSLQIEAAQLNVMTDVLVPLGVRHVFFKGASLAYRYHAVPSARPSRDLDVLVEPDSALAVVRQACERGYAPAGPVKVGTSEPELAAWVKRQTVQSMHAPNGTLIEIHQSLDHGDGLLDVGRMLSRAEILDFHGRPLSVLRTSDLFVYICMHHTRHFWSHLHWYADLDAMTGHPLFDPDEVREVAASLKLTSTVDACLQLNEFARSADWPREMSLDGDPGTALLLRSIDCLEGGLQREYALRSTKLSEDRAFTWQSTTGERARLFVRRLRKQFLRVVNGISRRARALFGAAETQAFQGKDADEH
jgi:hypothetical protein